MDVARGVEPDLQMHVRLDLIRGMTLADAAIDMLASLDTEADWWGKREPLRVLRDLGAGVLSPRTADAAVVLQRLRAPGRR
jgi:hypothetical protein